MNIAPVTATLAARAPAPSPSRDTKYGPFIGAYEATGECAEPYTRDYQSLRLGKGIVGAADGYASYDDAVAAVGALLDAGKAPSAAIQQIDNRFFAHTVFSRHYDNGGVHADYSKPMTPFGEDTSFIGGDNELLVHQDAARAHGVRAIMRGSDWVLTVDPVPAAD